MSVERGEAEITLLKGELEEVGKRNAQLRQDH